MSPRRVRILLATTPLAGAERYGSLDGAGSSVPNLGLLSLAAVARAAGHDCAVVDAAACGIGRDEFLRRVAAFAPELVGFSATTLEVAPAAATAEAVRGLLPAVRILLGGSHVSAAPEETLRRYAVFDAAALGEGEATLVEFLAAVAAGTDVAAVPGVICRRGAEVLRAPQRPPISDLDQLPHPAWDLLEGFPRRFSPPAFKTRQLPAASLVTSRGCPNRCIFCDRSVFGSQCRAFSAEYVVGMIRELHERHGVREFCFEDDTFVTFRARLEEICRRLIDLRLGISWTCLGRVNQITEEGLGLMRRAGCWQIGFGIESGSQPILTLIRKNVTLDQIRRGLAMSRAAGMLNKGFFIVGHPGETAQSLRETIDFALELPLDDVSVTMLTPFPGTELGERAAEFGSFDPDWSRMNLLNAVFVPHGLTADDLAAAQRELLRRFYLRPRVLANYCGRLARTPSLALGLWRGFRAFLRTVGR